MKFALIRMAASTADAFNAAIAESLRRFSDPVPVTEPRDCLRVGQLHRADVSEATQFTLPIETSGDYALFTEHLPSEFDMVLMFDEHSVTPSSQREFKPDHEHDDSITSVGISRVGDLDPHRVRAWLDRLLREQGQDLFRCKGVLSLRGDPRRHVFQGVHMLMDASADREWGTEPRHNTLVFIGRNLDRQALTRDFAACLA